MCYDSLCLLVKYSFINILKFYFFLNILFYIFLLQIFVIEVTSLVFSILWIEFKLK
jgi:hypothetical protein